MLCCQAKQITSIKCSMVPPLLNLHLCKFWIDEEVHLELAFLAQGEKSDTPSPSIPVRLRASDAEPEQFLRRAATTGARLGPITEKLLGHINSNPVNLCVDSVDVCLDVGPREKRGRRLPLRHVHCCPPIPSTVYRILSPLTCYPE